VLEGGCALGFERNHPNRQPTANQPQPTDSIAAALLSFSSGDAAAGGASTGLGAHLVTIIALILLPVAMAMNGYGGSAV
jgi:hypothetical protein